MRVVQIEEDFGLENLKLREREQPRAPGRGEVLVRMRAASLNARDLLTVQGRYNPRQKLPLIPCSDGVGTVEAVGEDVDSIGPGDRVITCFAQGWIDGPLTHEFRRVTLGGPLDGTLSDWMVLPEYGVLPVPEFLSDVEAATLPCAALTAWSAVVEQAGLLPGETVLVEGTGGVALFALQFAKLFRARVIITSKSDEKLERARALGADETLNYLEQPDWAELVKERTAGKGADLVIELGGQETLSRAIRAVKTSGQISMIGVLSGAEATIRLPLVVMRNVRLQGVTVGSRRALQRMLEAIESSRLRPVVDQTFPFESSREAFEYLSSGRHFGKVCIRIAGSD